MRRGRLISAALLLAATLAIGAGALDWRADAARGSITVPATALAQLHSGDLIFREGTELVSDAISTADHGGYSHVGMLLHDANGWRVIHAVPAERAGRKDAVVIDSLDFFDGHAQARRVGVFVVDVPQAARDRAVAYARAHLGEPFRVRGAGTYCTRLVWQAYRAAGVDLHVHFTTLDLPLMRGEYLLPSGLRSSPQLHRVWSGS